MTARTTLPPWEMFLAPVLRSFPTTLPGPLHLSEIVDRVCQDMGISPEQQEELLPGGRRRAENRITWALSTLVSAGAVTRWTRVSYGIDLLGIRLIHVFPDTLTYEQLTSADLPGRPFPEPGDLSHEGRYFDVADDPIEVLEQSIARMHDHVTGDLLSRLRQAHPTFLEHVVLDLLMAMGYGGAEGRPRHLGGTNDEGVDGVIEQDPLGLEKVYVQAKRHAANNSVGREMMQAFYGALHGRGADRGIFITTSRFTKHAVEYAAGIGTRIVLIDGKRLADLMIRYRIGVQLHETYTVVQLDDGFFK